jgi:hypothetical protein
VVSYIAYLLYESGRTSQPAIFKIRGLERHVFGAGISTYGNTDFWCGLNMRIYL